MYIYGGCMYICIYAYVRTRTQSHTHTSSGMCVHPYTAYIYILVYMYMCIYAYVRTHTHNHTHTQTNTHTHTHTHNHPPPHTHTHRHVHHFSTVTSRTYTHTPRPSPPPRPPPTHLSHLVVLWDKTFLIRCPPGGLRTRHLHSPGFPLFFPPLCEQVAVGTALMGRCMPMHVSSSSYTALCSGGWHRVCARTYTHIHTYVCIHQHY